MLANLYKILQFLEHFIPQQYPVVKTVMVPYFIVIMLSFSRILLSQVTSSPNERNPSSDKPPAGIAPVIEWLKTLGLSRYEDAFVREEIDWDTLQCLTEEVPYRIICSSFATLFILAASRTSANFGQRYLFTHHLPIYTLFCDDESQGHIFQLKLYFVELNLTSFSSFQDLFNLGIDALGPRKKIVHALNGMKGGNGHTGNTGAAMSNVNSTDKVKQFGGNKLITEFFRGPGAARSRCQTVPEAPPDCGAAKPPRKVEGARKATARRGCRSSSRYQDIPAWCCIPGTPFRVVRAFPRFPFIFSFIWVN